MGAEDITQLLARAREGGPERLSAVFEALYPELVRLANSRLRGGEGTLSPTVLVHELFLRITQGNALPLNDRNHFFAASANARARATAKRGGGQVMVELDDQVAGADPALTNVLALDKALEALEAISPQRRQVVELRWFGGLEFSEIASLLDVSERTVCLRLLHRWLRYPRRFRRGSSV